MLSQPRLLLHAVAATILAAVSAQAQKPALTKSVDEPGRNPYSQTAVIPCPGSGGSCTLAFPAVPLGYRLVVTHVSINYFSNDALPDPAQLTQSQNTLLYEYLPALFEGRNLQYGVSAMVTYFVEAGSAPEIVVSDAKAGFLASGSINGYLVAIP